MTRSTPSDLSIFSSAPDTRLFQPLGSIESCRVQLEAMLRTDAGLGLLIGPPGTGKSLLCQVLSESLRDPFEVVLLAESVPRDQLSLLQNILFHLNMPYKNFSEGELRLSLIDRLTQSVHSRTHGLILIVDEAQSLPDSILEEIRMITNIVRGGRSCVRTVLAGNHELEDRISQPGMESLAQRVAVRSYLHPLNQADTANYLRAMLASVDDSPSIDDEATAAIHFATGGIPRLIHQMMRQILASAADGAIDVELVNRAWSQSRQLASPVLEPEFQQPAQGDNGIVEFGELSCNAADAPAATDAPSATDAPFATDAPAGPQAVETGTTDDQSAPPTNAVADTMPEIAAELDRVTDSLLRISDQQYDESHALDDDTAESNAAAEAAPPAACDMTVIDASVQWSVEDPESFETAETAETADSEAFQPPAAVVERDTLFGDGFDEEETVPGLLASGLPPVAALPAATEERDDAAEEPDAALPAEESACENNGCQENVYEDDGCQPEHDLHSEVACISVEASTIRLNNDVAPPAPAIGTDGVGTGEPLTDDIRLNDDSDMLIIEDVVDIEPAPVRAVVFDDDPTDSVDYQMLFNRMRQG